MIPVDSLLYKIDQKLNKLSTNEHQQIPIEDKILALNAAQIKLLIQKVDGISVTSGTGLDAFKKRYEDLQKFVELYDDHILPLVEVDTKLNRWAVSLAGISPAYMLYLDSYVIADKGRCKGRVIWINKELAKRGDLQFLLNNTHYKPSFEYQETFNFISSDELSVFTDGTFTPIELHLSYLRYPAYIDKAGYTKFDGSASSDVNSELKSYMEEELLDLTVQNLAMYTENASAAQNAQYRIQTNE